VDSHNVIKLEGLCIEPSQVCMMLELCEHGHLHGCLERGLSLQGPPSHRRSSSRRATAQRGSSDKLSLAPEQHIAPALLSEEDQITVEVEAMSWMERLHLVGGTARGMKAVHECQLCHRDLKTTNVMVGRKGDAKVADFGTARLRNARMSIHVGTLNYTAPELHGSLPLSPNAMRQYAELQREYDGELADVYSFGFVMYEAFCNPAQQQRMDPRTLEECKAGVAPEAPVHAAAYVDCPEKVFNMIRDLLARCWAENPSERPTFVHLAGAIDQMLVDYNLVRMFA